MVKLENELILLAGAAGFIGSHLAESLVAAGCQVVGLDNFSTGSKANLSSLKGSPNFELIKCDITEDLPPELKRKNFTHIVAASGTSFYLGQEKKELDELLLASHGTRNLLELAIKKGAVFLLLSSTEIYQGVAGSFSLEHYFDSLELSQKLSFLEGRRFAEVLVQQCSDLYDLDARVARLATVYGPRMSLATRQLLPCLINLALEQKDLILNEDGSCELRLVFITDVVYGLTKLLLDIKPSVKKSIFNFVNPEKVSVLSVAYTLKQYYPKEPKIEFLPPGHKLNFTYTEAPKIHRTQKELFWEPKIDITEGIDLTLKYFQDKKREQAVKGLVRDEKETLQRIDESKELIAPVSEKFLPQPSLLQRFSAALKIGQKVAPPEEIKGWLALKKKQERRVPESLKGVEFRKKPVISPSHLKRKALALIVFLFLGALALPMLASAVFAKLGATHLKTQKFDLAQSNFLTSQAFWSVQKRPLTFLGQEKLWHLVDTFVSAGFFAARSGQDFQPGLVSLKETGQEIFDYSTILGGKKEGAIDQDQFLLKLENTRLSLQAAYADYEFFQEKFQKACELSRQTRFFSFLNCEKYQPLVNEVSNVALVLSQILENGPRYLSFDAPQTHLIFLQNNTEIRATGGFVGSYLVLDLKEGQVTRFKVDDIYNPDGILKQKIAAPEPIKKYMEVTELGIRDANWWPDFPESAEKMATLYEFATGEKVSTVVALNLEVIRSFLKASGEIFLPSYQEKITADNLFERAEVHSEVNFEPGSTQKKDFLGNLAQAMLTKLMQGQNINWLNLGESLLLNLSQKNILLYSREHDLQETLVRANWAGEIQKDWGKDYLLVVDSNFGGNKANFWITRAQDYELITDREGNLTATLTVKWRHTGQSETWPGGEYQNFLRVYTPLGSRLIEQEGFSDEVMVYEESGKTVWGGLVKVPINSERKITLKYQLPQVVGFKNSQDYRLLIQKQSGMGSEEFNFDLNLPVFLKVASGTTLQNLAFTKDELIQVAVAR